MIIKTNEIIKERDEDHLHVVTVDKEGVAITYWIDTKFPIIYLNSNEWKIEDKAICDFRVG